MARCSFSTVRPLSFSLRERIVVVYYDETVAEMKDGAQAPRPVPVLINLQFCNTRSLDRQTVIPHTLSVG